MTLRSFVKQNREAIDKHIRAACSNVGTLNDEDRADWTRNDESLYNWAKTEGWPG